MAKNQPYSSDPQGDMPEWGRPNDVTPGEPVATGQLTPGGPAVQSLVEWLAGKVTETDQGTFAMMEAAIARMLQSESPDQVLAEDMPLHGKEFVDQPFTCHGFQLHEGDFEEGAPFYALLECTIGNTGERRVISCGGWKVLAQLMMLDQMVAWPQVMIIRGRQTRQGYTVLSLQRPI